MLVKTIPVGHLDTNCYIVTNEQNLECVVIDPGDESNTIMDYLESNNLKCKAIFLTHSHFDHTGAVEAVRAETGAIVYMNRLDDKKYAPNAYTNFTLPDDGIYYADGDCVEVCGLSFHIIGTPGHTPGGVCIRCEDALFTGDTLFRGTCGRTDLPGGSTEEILRSLKKICELPGDYEVYPGHMESSSLERERNFNYYCRSAI